MKDILIISIIWIPLFKAFFKKMYLVNINEMELETIVDKVKKNNDQGTCETKWNR